MTVCKHVRLWRFRFAFIFEKYFINAIEAHFFCVCTGLDSSKRWHSGEKGEVARIFDCFTGSHDFLEFSEPPTCLKGVMYVNTEKLVYRLNSWSGWFNKAWAVRPFTNQCKDGVVLTPSWCWTKICSFRWVFPFLFWFLILEWLLTPVLVSYSTTWIQF